MFLTGTIINTVSVIIAGMIGMILKDKFTSSLRETLTHACAVSTIFIGISSTLSKMLYITASGIETKGAMTLIVSLIIGCIIGTLIDIEDKTEKLASFVKKTVKRNNDTSFQEGFINSSIVICVGAMAIVGAIEDGIKGDYTLLCSKSVLDFIIVALFSSTYGIGAAFSGVILFLYQGSITVLARFLAPFLTDACLNDLSLVGSALIFCVGINILFGKKIKVENFLPSLVVAVFCHLVF